MAQLPLPYDRELARCTSAQAQHVLEFLRLCLRNGGRFHGEELRCYVAQRVPTAPDSARRVMLDLASRQQCEYELLSKTQSLYRVIWVEEE